MHESHREYKKHIQRQQILTGALRLFAQKGYDETTIADIVQAAGCAQRTFFLYFRSKEDILPALLQQSVHGLRVSLEERTEGQDTLTIFEQWMLTQLAHHSGAQDFQPHASLIAKQKQHLSILLEPLLTQAFAKDLGLAPSDSQSKLAATAAILSLSALELQHTTHAQRIEYVQQASIFLRAGIKAITNTKTYGE